MGVEHNQMQMAAGLFDEKTKGRESPRLKEKNCVDWCAKYVGIQKVMCTKFYLCPSSYSKPSFTPFKY